jgi:drug/metabolite transporter (DMT)-like permease
MSTKRLIGIALLVAGIILLVLGYQSSQGLDDQITEAITGEFTDRTLWYWISGGISSVLGLVFLSSKA